MTTLRLYIILLAAVVMTVVITLAPVEELLSRRYTLIPGPEGQQMALGAGVNRDGRPSGKILDIERRAYSCEVEKAVTNYYCALIWPITPDLVTRRPALGSFGQGLDLSSADYLTVDIDYDGPEKHIRFYMRAFNPGYYVEGDPNSLKYMALLLDKERLNAPYTVPIKKFVVADWWLALYQVPERLSGLELNEISQFGIDFPTQEPRAGTHKITLNSVVVTDQLVSESQVYLAIIYFWMTGLVVFLVAQLVRMRLLRVRQEAQIHELNEEKESLARDSDRFRKLSTVDSLTDSYNRFGIDQIINTLHPPETKLSEAQRFSIVFLDIDHFKRVNDQYGHDVGDEVLAGVASTLKAVVEGQGYVGRWGGEEFLVILPEVDIGGAKHIAEEIRREIEEHEYSSVLPTPTTVSLGVGDLRPDEDFGSFFKRVDHAMYRAKNSGRNRVCVADGTIGGH